MIHILHILYIFLYKIFQDLGRLFPCFFWLKMYRFLCICAWVSFPMLSASFASERSWLCRSFVPKLSEELCQKLVAHRGFHCPLLSDKRPLECTLPALQMAWNAGLRHCECDVRLSLDQKIIVLHDPNLDRLVSKESAKPTPNANTLQAAELQRWPLCQEDIHIPLLEEVLKAALKSGSRLVACQVKVSCHQGCCPNISTILMPFPQANGC